MAIDVVKIEANPVTEGTLAALRSEVRTVRYEIGEGLAAYPNWQSVHNPDGSVDLRSDIYVDTFRIGALGRLSVRHEVDTRRRRVIDEVDVQESLDRPTLFRADTRYVAGFKDRDESGVFSGGLDENTALNLVLRLKQIRGVSPVPTPRSGE